MVCYLKINQNVGCTKLSFSVKRNALAAAASAFFSWPRNCLCSTLVLLCVHSWTSFLRPLEVEGYSLVPRRYSRVAVEGDDILQTFLKMMTQIDLDDMAMSVRQSFQP